MRPRVWVAPAGTPFPEHAPDEPQWPWVEITVPENEEPLLDGMTRPTEIETPVVKARQKRKSRERGHDGHA